MNIFLTSISRTYSGEFVVWLVHQYDHMTLSISTVSSWSEKSRILSFCKVSFFQSVFFWSQAGPKGPRLLVYNICVSILNLYVISLEQLIWYEANLAVFEINPLQSIQLENSWRCFNPSQIFQSANLSALPALSWKGTFKRDWPLPNNMLKLKWQFAQL